MARSFTYENTFSLEEAVVRVRVVQNSDELMLSVYSPPMAVDDILMDIRGTTKLIASLTGALRQMNKQSYMDVLRTYENIYRQESSK